MVAGVYLHIPFCKSRCSYCDFATDVYRDSKAVERYVDAICREIGPPEGGTPNGVDTIYFGGGTPSLLSAKQVEKILAVISDRFDVTQDAEITMEMNPATVSAETLREYRGLGVNRASFGVQTFDDRALRLLARGHDADDARNTFKLLRKAGFDNISFDLIAGLPNQTIEDWERNLDDPDGSNAGKGFANGGICTGSPSESGASDVPAAATSDLIRRPDPPAPWRCRPRRRHGYRPGVVSRARTHQRDRKFFSLTSPWRQPLHQLQFSATTACPCSPRVSQDWFRRRTRRTGTAYPPGQ